MNLNDIARLAGVSKSTASRALSNNGSVSNEACQKVMAVVKQYNYKPSRYARILNNKSSHLIGIITPDIINPYFPEIIEYITEIANENGYRIILCNYDRKYKSQTEYLGMLKELRVDGTILLCPTADLTDISQYSDMPILSIDGIINKDIPYVCSDFYKGGFIAGSKLVNNQCKHILHILGNENYYANIQRSAGFQAAAKNHSGQLEKVMRLPNITNSNSYETIKTYILDHPEIDGIFADNDSIAFMVLRILQELHIGIPGQIKLIGYDDNFMISMVYPLLSTIHQPIADIGKTAITTLLSQIRGQQIKKQNILDVKYIKRDTTLV